MSNTNGSVDKMLNNILTDTGTGLALLEKIKVFSENLENHQNLKISNEILEFSNENQRH